MENSGASNPGLRHFQAWTSTHPSFSFARATFGLETSTFDFRTRIPGFRVRSSLLEIVERHTSKLHRFSFDVEPCGFGASNKTVHARIKLVQHRS